MGAFDLLAGIVARLASTPRLEDFVEAVAHEIVTLGFGGVWIAILDEHTGELATLKDLTDGVDTTRAVAARLPIEAPLSFGDAFPERGMINVTDPASLHLEHDASAVPAHKLVLPRAIDDRLRGRPFAYGPVLGQGSQVLGALALSGYHGSLVIPDELLEHGLLRGLRDLLGIAMERARNAARLERLEANLDKAHAVFAADERIKTVGRLADSVAHDLNVLCGIALLSVHVAARSPADAFAERPRIEGTIRTIGGLVGRLQRAARPPSSDVQTADLPRIIDDILVMMKPVLNERSTEVDFELVAVPEARCDPVLVQQVTLNLVINAHEALAEMPSDRRRIKIDVGHHGGVVRLVVADTGPGIAPEIFARLFKPSVTTKGNEHLGLGLAGSRASLALYDGTIEARNAPAGGAVFEVTLPVAPPSAGPSEPLRRTGPVQVARFVAVLAIDDDSDVLELICDVLKPLGHQIVTATNAVQALAAATTEAFDLVLCDLGIPDHRGIEACQVLRETGYRGKLVLMTGWDTHRLNHDPRTLAGERVLKKPFGGAELLHVIDAVLAS